MSAEVVPEIIDLHQFSFIDRANDSEWNTSYPETTSVTSSISQRYVSSAAVVIVTSIMVFGAFGNGLVFFVVRKRVKQSPFNWFLSCLALLDFVACVTQIPVDLITLLHPNYPSYIATCQITGFLGAHTVVASAIILSCVAYFRFSVVCKPYSSRFSVSDAKKACFLALSLPLAIAWPQIFICDIRVLSVDNDYYYSDCGVSREMKTTFYPHIMYGLLCMVFFVSVSIMIICYVRIAMTLKNRIKIGSVSFSKKAHIDIALIEITAIVPIGQIPPAPNREAQNGKPKKALLLMVCVTVLFCASFIPHWVVMAICLTSTKSEYANDIPPTAYSLLIRSIFLNNFLNPFLYGFYHREFITDLKQIFRKWLCFRG